MKSADGRDKAPHENKKSGKKQQEMQLVYDGKCPVCTVYCAGLLRETENNNLTLVDARKPGALMDEINACHLDIDEGMVLKTEGRLFYGADAIREISKRNKTNGLWGWINRIFFSSKILAGIFYPLGKLFRNAILRFKGIEKIRNLEKGL